MNRIVHLNDLFWTLQGEGANSGRRALFVRMPYCNLSCSWCDTQFNSFKKWTTDELKAFARSESARFAVITGGEPMMHKHTGVVVEALKEVDFKIACETNGTFPIVSGIDFVTVSPKRDAEYRVHPHALVSAHEFKYVVDQEFQWEILKRHNTRDGRRYSLSPEFGRFQASVKEILNYIQENPDWRLSLQTHKWIQVP